MFCHYFFKCLALNTNIFTKYFNISVLTRIIADTLTMKYFKHHTIIQPSVWLKSFVRPILRFKPKAQLTGLANDIILAPNCVKSCHQLYLATAIDEL